jgi:5-methyltetrahydrofolate--homocysteine methyltransferase
MRQRLTEILKTGRILVSDGAWGTFLYNKGLRAGDCPDEWSLSHPDAVREIADSYINAGADMIETNSFGANCYKLAHYGLQERCAEVNRAAAQLSRQAAGNARHVIASVGPTGKMLLMGDVTEQELYDCFSEQVTALAQGGADAICIETMSDADEAVAAIRAAKEQTKLEVIATFTFERTGERQYHTMMGLTPQDAAARALEADADIIGANCGNGIERMTEITEQLREAFPQAFILIHANAGLPVLRDDGTTVFPDTPAIMAAHVPQLIAAGANIIGGCCGTTPEHIKAIKKQITK